MKGLGYLFILILMHMHSLDAHERDHHHDHEIYYHVERTDYTFSTIFDLSRGKTYMGSVVKSVFHLRTHYDAYDHLGIYEGQGICRFFCLGLFYVWATEIDIYNAQGEKIGLIDGQVVSSEAAKFSFYNEQGHRVAIGYLDQHNGGFNIVDPNHTTRILARLNRNFILDKIDNWEVIIFDKEHIHPRLVKIFAAFACDSQHKFKADL